MFLDFFGILNFNNYIGYRIARKIKEFNNRIILIGSLKAVCTNNIHTVDLNVKSQSLLLQANIFNKNANVKYGKSKSKQ